MLTPNQGEGGSGTPTLAAEPDILGCLDQTLRESGLVAARGPAARLIYLAVVTRLFARPVSLVIKGPSSAGKSWLLKLVLALCPPSAFHELTAMSEKALIYDETPLVHRHLVVYEAAGLASETGAYALRSLLSEGAIRYCTVESGKDGLRSKLVTRPGPTGLLSSTTALALDGETETRFISVPISDTREGTRAIFDQWGAKAAGLDAEAVDVSPWHELGVWLEQGERRVVVPYAPQIASLLPPSALRLQRDFISTLTLIQGAAFLHRATRERDSEGRIIATLDDYCTVRELVEPLIADTLGATVKPPLRRTVEAVGTLTEDYPEGVPQSALTDLLDIDKGAVSRRVREARAAGFLWNEEDRRGRPARLKVGEAMPSEDVCVLPLPSELGDTPPPPDSGSTRSTPPSEFFAHLDADDPFAPHPDDYKTEGEAA